MKEVSEERVIELLEQLVAKQDELLKMLSEIRLSCSGKRVKK